MPPSDEARQRAYYQATAASYHERHVGEHCSFLDVGAGTGRAMVVLATAFPQARVQGIEPVAELRQQAEIQNGISSDDLREGDALQLPFADDSFDWVVETGVLHHIRHWPQAVAEMARVARHGVLISDTRNIGQGSPRTRKMIMKMGLWAAFVWLQTKGKIRNWIEGDVVYYSFYAFDALSLLRCKIAQVQVMNTQCSGEADMLSALSHGPNMARRAV